MRSRAGCSRSSRSWASSARTCRSRATCLTKSSHSPRTSWTMRWRTSCAPGTSAGVTEGPARAAGGLRLNKLLASRGIGARRKCDALIRAGSVRVNGTVVKEPGATVHPERDRVTVHGRPIPGRSALRYLMVHKPVGVITTLEDPEGRPTVRTLLPTGPRLFPVGRLDAETSGLLIATNDGALAHHLMHPRYGVRKVYRVRVDRPADDNSRRGLAPGSRFEPGGWTGRCRAAAVAPRPAGFETG